MKNKLIFRILGALASALIIVSVFVPFVSVTGYSPSLWETYELANSLYLPIMIIVFGAIGVIFFALNVKTEFAYMSVGAITFFLVIRTIDILDQGAFGSLSIGYYFLIVGAFLTGLMAFLTNLKSKKKETVIEEVKKAEPSMLDQIDKLYTESTTTQSEISPIQPVDNIVQPLPVQPIEAIAPIQPVEQVVEEKVEEEVTLNPVVQELPTQNTEVVQQPTVEQIQVENVQPPVNPVVQDFYVPVVEETPMEQPVQPTVETSINPVLQEFNVPSTPAVQEQPVNPVLQEFGISGTPVVEDAPAVTEQPIVNQEVPYVPLSNLNDSIVGEFNNQSTIPNSYQQNSNELDIFGQPINKS